MKFIVLADIHFREEAPECRLESTNAEWLATFSAKMRFVTELARKQKVSGIFVAGDLFHSWRTNRDEFIVWVIKQLNHWRSVCPVYTIPGNHDSMGGKEEELYRTPYQMLAEAGVIHDLPSKPLKQVACYLYTKEDRLESHCKIVMAHKMLWHNSAPFPGAPETGNIEWFVRNRLNPECRLLISGDNHKPFLVEVDDCTVINCGSFSRQEASQIDYKPAVWVVEMDDTGCVVTPHYLPLALEISRSHIDNMQERVEMLDGAVAEIDNNFEVTLNFKENYRNMAKDHADYKKLMLKFEECNK